METKPSIVLVHGAWADGTSWQHVIPLLEQDGYTVTAVQNPLTSAADDVATTKRVIDAQPGPVVVVGHSYGGAAMTGAAAGNPNVKALVYLAAFAPEVGEPVGAYLEKYPTPLGTGLAPDSAGFIYIDRSKFNEIFAKDVNPAEQRVMARRGRTSRPGIWSPLKTTPSARTWSASTPSAWAPPPTKSRPATSLLCHIPMWLQI